MWKILLLLISTQVWAAPLGPIIWGSNNNALYLPTNKPSSGTQCLTVDPLGVIMPQLCAAGATGTVTSVAVAVPAEFSVSGSPVTTSGTITISKANQSANLVYAGPSSGGAAAPTFRALVPADIPGGVNGSITAITGNYTSSVSGEFIVANCAVLCTVNLPNISATDNFRVSMKNIGTAHAVFHNVATQLIDGANDYDLYPNKSHVNLISLGGQWYVY